MFDRAPFIIPESILRVEGDRARAMASVCEKIAVKPGAAMIEQAAHFRKFVNVDRLLALATPRPSVEELVQKMFAKAG